MSQYDDSRNPFSAASSRPEGESPWAETPPPANPGPGTGSGRGGLQLPGEANTVWGSDGLQRPSPMARRRNQWREHQQLTPDFNIAPSAAPPVAPPIAPLEPEPVVRPSARNAALPTFKRGPAPEPPRAASPQRDMNPQRVASPQRPHGPTRPEDLRQGPSAPPRSPQAGAAPLQMHPHSIHPSTLNASATAPPLGLGSSSTGALPPNVTPLRPPQRRWSKPGPGEPAAQTGRLAPADPRRSAVAPEPIPLAPGILPEVATPPRRSRAATARRRLANPPLPLLYLIRLIILGVGVAAIAGTLLSVLSPSNVASSRDGTAPAVASNSRQTAAGGLAQGRAAGSVTDLRLTTEITRLKGELEQLATLTPGLTPVAFAVDLDSGQYVDLGGAEPVAAASTIKVPILVAFLQQVDAGTIALNQSIVLQEEFMAGGSGTLRGEAVGTEYTALEIATRMIVTSDNTATNMMIAALGGIEALNQTFVTWGLEHTLLRNPLPDLDGTNITSAKDLALIMALVDQGGLLSPRSRDRLFSIMQRTENGSLIPSGIRDQSVLANKTGDIGAMLGDIALIDVPNGKRYTLALMVQRPTNDGRASELIRRMTETIHAEMAQPVAPVGNPNAAPLGDPSAAPLGDPGATENPYSIENPDAVAPVDMNPPSRTPARDEIPPG